MKIPAIVAALAAALTFHNATAQDEHSAHHPAGAQAEPGDSGDKAMGGKMGKMQQQMEKMQELMDKIHATTDPAERQKLMQEHMQAMHEGMKMMKGMGGGMKMGMMGSGKRQGSATGAAESDHGQDGAGQAMAQGGDQMSNCMKMMEGMMGGGMMMKKHKMMEGRMDMMQMMMEQMMQHEEAELELEMR